MILFLNFGGIFNKDGSHRACQKYVVVILNTTRTYKIQAYMRTRKLKCFQIEMARKIKLLIRLCRLPSSLDNSSKSK